MAAKKAASGKKSTKKKSTKKSTKTTKKTSKKPARQTTRKKTTKKSSRKATALPATGSEPTHDEIAARAFMVWERKGKPAGQDYYNWKEAEAELRAERGLI